VAQGLNAHATEEQTRSGGTSTGLAGVGSWMGGHGSTAVARSLRRMRESEKVMEEKAAATEEDEGEWGQPRPGSPYL
jgi:hypothetical protein